MRRIGRKTPSFRFQSPNKLQSEKLEISKGRAVELDIRPDTFAAAILRGREPMGARVRKLTVAVWHLLQGRWNKALEENTTHLTKLPTDLGLPTLKELGYTSKIAFQEQKLEVLRTHP